jgi:hypothetical protein
MQMRPVNLQNHVLLSVVGIDAIINIAILSFYTTSAVMTGGVAGKLYVRTPCFSLGSQSLAHTVTPPTAVMLTRQEKEHGKPTQMRISSLCTFYFLKNSASV